MKRKSSFWPHFEICAKMKNSENSKTEPEKKIFCKLHGKMIKISQKKIESNPPEPKWIWPILTTTQLRKFSPLRRPEQFTFGIDYRVRWNLCLKSFTDFLKSSYVCTGWTKFWISARTKAVGHRNRRFGDHQQFYIKILITILNSLASSTLAVVCFADIFLRLLEKRSAYKDGLWKASNAR